MQRAGAALRIVTMVRAVDRRSSHAAAESPGGDAVAETSSPAPLVCRLHAVQISAVSPRATALPGRKPATIIARSGSVFDDDQNLAFDGDRKRCQGECAIATSLSSPSQIETKTTPYLPCEQRVNVTTMKVSHDAFSLILFIREHRAQHAVRTPHRQAL